MITTCVFSIRIGSASELHPDYREIQRESCRALYGVRTENRSEGKTTGSAKMVAAEGIGRGTQLTLQKALNCLVKERVQSRGGLPLRTPSRTPFRAPKFCSLIREQPPLLVSRSLSKERCYNRPIIRCAYFDCR